MNFFLSIYCTHQ